MTSPALGLIGFLFLITAAVVAVLNLKRVAGLGMPWLPPLFIVVGAAFVAFAKRRGK